MKYKIEDLERMGAVVGPPVRIPGVDQAEDPVEISSKYRAVPTEVDGIRFASKREAARYCSLRIMEEAGVIFGLELQPKFALVVKGVKICDYVADFAYLNGDGKRVIEDAKGVKTPVYRLKKKLLKAIHDIEVLET